MGDGIAGVLESEVCGVSASLVAATFASRSLSV